MDDTPDNGMETQMSDPVGGGADPSAGSSRGLAGHRAQTRLTTRGKVVLAATLGLVLIGAGLGGLLLLGGGGDPSADGDLDAAGAPATPVQTVSTVSHVTGQLSSAQRRAVAKAVAQSVDSWWDAAYLDGTWPREAASFTASDFPSFSPGAARQAVRDRRQLTNARLAGQITAVEPVRKKVTVDVFAPKGTAVGADAEVVLVFDALGPDRRVTLRGQVSLTPVSVGQGASGWQIYDYDLGYASSPIRQPGGAGSSDSASTDGSSS